MVDGIQPGIELSQDDLGVSDDPGIHMDIFIDFRTVNINLENFGIFCKLEAFPVTRSLKRAPTTISRSASVIPKFEVFVPCMPTMPV